MRRVTEIEPGMTVRRVWMDGTCTEGTVTSTKEDGTDVVLTLHNGRKLREYHGSNIKVLLCECGENPEPGYTHCPHCRQKYNTYYANTCKAIAEVGTNE